jgi:hypothetical protein
MSWFPYFRITRCRTIILGGFYGRAPRADAVGTYIQRNPVAHIAPA